MPLILNPAMAATDVSPVPEVARWLKGIDLPADRPLINVSQAAPVAPPPRAMREAMAAALLDRDEMHLYGPDLGMPALRSEVAEHTRALYGGAVAADQVAITSGCNQAFAAALATLAGPGDEVLLPIPWYFNHKMWLDMSSVRAVPLPTGPSLVPDPDAAARLLTPRSRAIILVTPNNPAGVEYPPEIIAAFRDLARARGLALIVDETYRDFRAAAGPPHDLFADPDWPEVLIHLYSFSKSYRLTGHRIGAMAASAARLAEVEKFIDSVTICPSQIGQFGALWAMRNLSQWLQAEAAEIRARGAAMRAGFERLRPQGWRLDGCGAYFAYAAHPFPAPADEVARMLVREAGVLCLPGTMFSPPGDPSGARHLRLAFANLDAAGIGRLIDRLAALGPG